MSTSSHPQTSLLEAEAYVEATTGYTSDEVSDIIAIYKELTKYIPFRDTRRDRRFVVKFHDILYYTQDDDEFDDLFERFCYEQYDIVTDGFTADSLRAIMASRQVGHYDTFAVHIPAITRDNAIQLAIDIYEAGYYTDYVAAYVTLTTRMMDLEANYLTRWVEFLRDYGRDDWADDITRIITNKENNNGRIN